jgi:valyl-tRNA synthetase
MLHPLMPFITEELWNAMDGRGDYPLITAKWPEPEAQADPHAKEEIDLLIEVVSNIRSLRTEYNVPWSTRLTIHIAEPTPALEEALFRNAGSFLRMANSHVARFGSTASEIDQNAIYVMVEDNNAWMTRAGKGIPFIAGGREILLLIDEAIDLDAERTRLDKAAIAAEKERDSLAQRLANPNFTERAKPEAVDKAHADHEAKAAEAQRLRAALERLG